MGVLIYGASHLACMAAVGMANMSGNVLAAMVDGQYSNMNAYYVQFVLGANVFVFDGGCKNKIESNAIIQMLLVSSYLLIAMCSNFKPPTPITEKTLSLLLSLR